MATRLETSYTPTARPGDPIDPPASRRACPAALLVFRTTKAPGGFPHFETYARVTSFFELEPVERPIAACA